MIKRRHSLIILVTLLTTLYFSDAAVFAEVPDKPSRVYVKGRQLIVEKRLEDGTLGAPEPYVIRGITWSPATSAPAEGPDPLNPSEKIPYGFFFNWPNRRPQGHVIFNHWLRGEHERHYLKDISLMKEMNVNTIRAYTDFGGDAGTCLKILDEFYRNGIMVIMSVASCREDIEGNRYKKIVKMCKEHPAILMWNLGNEWNLDYNRYWGYPTVKDAALATNAAAKAIKGMDGNHPVASCLGDRFVDKDPDNTVERILGICDDVEVWGLNIYRGKTFAGLFAQWRVMTDKPMYLSEFGIDSFETTEFEKADGIRAAMCKGAQNHKAQAEYAALLTREIRANLSADDPGKVSLGGTMHTFNDCLWKVGSYHAGLGGLVEYFDPVEGVSYGSYNNEGFHLPGSSQDGIMNEEHFGVVDAGREPKEAFEVLKELYE
jgi:hypothetical protein